MTQPQTTVEPDWDMPLSLSLTPAVLIHALFSSADTVHTGWDSCVEHSLVVSDITALDDPSDNYVRLVEQEYVEEEESPEVTWHDWAVELKLGEALITAHWRAQNGGSPSDWDWCSGEAERAFTHGCVLIGKRVRRGLVIDEPSTEQRGSRTHH